MKVGDYVRTEKGILKIRDDKPFKDDKNKLNYLTYGNYTCVLKENIIKSSPNIIDLIEVGDYVNGKKVIDTFTDYIFDYSEEFKVIRFSETDILHDTKHIESIVTKEQFENMKYRILGETNEKE